MIIREFDAGRDVESLRDLVVELQNHEHQIDPGKPEGSSIVGAYTALMLARCRRWDGKVFVAELPEGVVGFVCVWARVTSEEPDDDPTEYAFVSDLVVRSAYRRLGIGRQLLAAAEEYARSKGSECLRLTVMWRNAVARRLYESVGFTAYEVELEKRFLSQRH